MFRKYSLYPENNDTKTVISMKHIQLFEPTLTKFEIIMAKHLPHPHFNITRADHTFLSESHR